ncbi:MAG: hypothetical protein DWP95_00625 [Proteobacteria bacterium]|nr:MAG: hypothetical protein DWP95_00625 [Pseudomonadota bacterium]
MTAQLPCGAQDLLEAAIVQKRRLNLVCLNQADQQINYQHILPLDVFSREGVEWLSFMYADDHGGIRRVDINTAKILSFQAVDNRQPILQYQCS